MRIARLYEAVEISPGNISVLVKGWRVEFTRDGETDHVVISVYGERGGLKARLGTSFEQIKDIVPKLDGTY